MGYWLSPNYFCQNFNQKQSEPWLGKTVSFVPEKLFFGYRMVIGNVQALVGEAVSNRQHDRALDAGGVQLTHERGTVALREFDDRLEAGADEVLVIVDEGRGARRD